MANLIEILLRADSGKAVAELKKVDKQLDQTGVSVKKADAGMADLGKTLVGMAATYLTIDTATRAISAMVREASEAEVIGAQLDAVLRSTKGAAGMTREELERLASTLSYMSAVEDDTIVKAEAVMLTFTKIGKDVFPDAIEAALNMSAALGQDLQSSVVQLGKALNDPITGVTALRRVGVSFTSDQMEMIKSLVESNQLLEAQKMILSELATEFGGAAEAMGGTNAGKIERAKNAFENLGEAIGGELLPVLGEAATTIELIITFSKRIEDALAQQEDTLRGEATSWEEYITKLKEAAAAAGYQVDAEGRLVNTWREAGFARTTVINDNYALTESEWALRNAIDDRRESIMAMEGATGVLEENTGALEDNTDAMALNIATLEEQIRAEALAAGLRADYTEAIEKHRDAISRLQDEHEELLSDLAAAKVEYGANSDEVNRLNDALGENEKKQREAADAIKETVAQMLYQKAAAGLDTDAALKLARAMGLISEEDYNIAATLQALRQEFDANNDAQIEAAEGADEYTEAVLDIYRALERLRNSNTPVTFENLAAALNEAERSGDDATAAMRALLAALRAIPSKKTVTVTTVFNTVGDPRAYTLPGTNITITPIRGGAQHGADFTVPPGFQEPQRPFLLAVSSGEHVEVTPANKPGSAEGVTVNINNPVLNSDMDVEMVAYRVAEVIRQKSRR